MTARKQQHGNGTKGNRDIVKPNFIESHKRSEVDTNDPRYKKVTIKATHPRKPSITKEIEYYSLEREVKRWQGDGYNVEVF